MNETLSLVVVDGRDPDLAEDDGAIVSAAVVSASDLDEIVVDGERGELLVGEASCARPHPRLVLVPVVSRLDDFMFDSMKRGLEKLLRCFLGRVGGI